MAAHPGRIGGPVGSVRSVGSARIIGLLAISMVAFGGCDEQSTGPPEPAAHTRFGNCGDEVRPKGFRCATLEVPLEREDPSLGKIGIEFAVREHLDPDAPEAPPIFAVEGGPGYGSMGSAGTYVKLFDHLLDSHDLVLVDMRGTGRSNVVDCADLQTGRAPDWIGVASCARQLGDAFNAYRTSAAADDIDDVRASLGFDSIDLYGDSYGTFLAQSYAFRHGDRVRALVLDSAYPVRGESGWYPSAVPTAVRSLELSCRRSAECPGDAGQRLNRFVRTLRDRHQSVGPLLTELGLAGNGPPASYLKIDDAIRAYLDGDEEPYERVTGEARIGWGKPDSYSHGQELAVSCNDYPMIWDKDAPEPERRDQLEREIRAYPDDAFAPFSPREVALADAGYLACLTWPPPGALYEPPADPDAPGPEMPTLVISGELDDVTTPAEGRMVADDFPNSELFAAANAGHVASLYDYESPPAREIRRFLRREG